MKELILTELGSKPIALALANNNGEAVQRLLAENPEIIHLPCSFLGSPFFTAIQLKDIQPEILNTLLEQGANINELRTNLEEQELWNRFSTPLLAAINCSDVPDTTIEYLIKHGASIGTNEVPAYYFLYIACLGLQEKPENNKALILVQALIDSRRDLSAWCLKPEGCPRDVSPDFDTCFWDMSAKPSLARGC